MIQDKKLLQKFHALPTDKQSEVIDFIEFLESRNSARPLDESKNDKKKRSFGSMKGVVKYMSDDFDEPLDDFAEYM